MRRHDLYMVRRLAHRRQEAPPHGRAPHRGADLALQPASGPVACSRSPAGKCAGLTAAMALLSGKRQDLTMVSSSVRSARLGWPSSSRWKAAATGMGSLMPASTGQVLCHEIAHFHATQQQSTGCISYHKLLTQGLCWGRLPTPCWSRVCMLWLASTGDRAATQAQQQLTFTHDGRLQMHTPESTSSCCAACRQQALYQHQRQGASCGSS